MCTGSEYPLVDGHASVAVYLDALRQCYDTLKRKKGGLSYNDFQYFAFHTPFAKMVQKSFFTMILHDAQL